MREIKFRGKSKSTGEWLYGMPLDMEYLGGEKDKVIFGKTGGPTMLEVTADNNPYAVEPETVGQFTGLHDKNGKEIYEGDIFERLYNEKYDFVRYAVIWDETKGQWWTRCLALHERNGGFKDISRGGFCTSSLGSNAEFGIEIIGNIHKNPELLTK